MSGLSGRCWMPVLRWLWYRLSCCLLQPVQWKMYAALARKNYDGSPAGADNNEYITLPETLKSFTMGAAKVYGRDHELGSLEEGKLADVIVLDRNL